MTQTSKQNTNPLFDTLTLITTKEYPTWNELPEEYKHGYSQFMINRFMSSQEALLPILDIVSSMRLSDAQHYEILINAVPQRRHYFKYEAYKKVEEDKELLHALIKEYNIGLREARMYAMDLSSSAKEEIKEKWHDYYEAINC